MRGTPQKSSLLNVSLISVQECLKFTIRNVLFWIAIDYFSRILMKRNIGLKKITHLNY